ncbi:MAG: ATP-dependent RNA helicase RhlE [Holosporales bacterium]
MSFLKLGLSLKLVEALEAVGFIKPTPIQNLSIYDVLKNKDVMASAQTGTGKTGCFLIPLIDFLIHSRKKNRLPRILILEPTRELATQVFEQFTKIADPFSLKAVVLVGGESNILQERALQSGVDVVIATPGRLIDLYDRQKILLHDIKTFVIDEADRMLDMGFIPDIDRLTGILPRFKQSLLFSATFNDEIEQLANKYLQSPKRISSERVNQTASTITQHVCFCSEKNKKDAFLELLKKHEDQQMIVFCNRKSDILTLVSKLQKRGMNAIDLHGDLTQLQRNERLDLFKKGDYKILLASDVAARGIDIKDLDVVINYDTPLHAQDYVHRIGRTGRANREGTAYTFAFEKDLKKITAIEALIKQKIDVLEIVLPQEKKEKEIKQKTNYRPKDVLEQNQNILAFGDFTPAFMLRHVDYLDAISKKYL